MSSFTHQVSKGTRFNQIYIPKNKEGEFEVGDIVQVKLVSKKNKLYYSKNLQKLSPFKEKIIQEIFSEVSKFREVKQVFIFGSFLTKKIDYNDIDIILISDNEKIEEKVYDSLIERLNLKFHVVSFKGEGLEKQLRISPVLRSMFYYFVSNKPFSVSKEKEIDVNHIKYLIWFPEDLLKVELDSENFYESLRRLICAEYFLKDKDIAPDKIDEVIKDDIEDYLWERIKDNRKITADSIKKIRELMRKKLKVIKGLIKDEQK